MKEKFWSDQDIKLITIRRSEENLLEVPTVWAQIIPSYFSKLQIV